MSKKNKSAKIVPLSPEKYLQQRVRQLPIHQCLVSKFWEKGRQPGVMISRKHSNGNITVCFYIVDLLCLGIMHTEFAFNVDEETYHEIVEIIYSRNELPEFLELDEDEARYYEIPYEMAHNIVYAGLEYSTEMDIPQHKDFRYTRYMLEEDTDDIELIDIECGMDGKPLLVEINLLAFTHMKTEFVEKKLIDNVGLGNFEVLYIDSVLNDLDEDMDDDSEIEDIFDDFYDEEGHVEFGEVPEGYDNEDYMQDKSFLIGFMKEKQQGNFDHDNYSDFENTLLRVANYMADPEKVKDYYNQYSFDSALQSCFYIPDELLLPHEIDNEDAFEAGEIIIKIFSDDLRKSKNKKLFKQLEEMISNKAFIAFLKLMKLYLSEGNDEKIKRKIEEYIAMFPDDKMLQLFKNYYKIMREDHNLESSDKHIQFSTLLPEREFLHYIEALLYLSFISYTFDENTSIEEILAFNALVSSMDLEEPTYEVFFMAVNDLLSIKILGMDTTSLN